jgi:hypothetical protein
MRLGAYDAVPAQAGIYRRATPRPFVLSLSKDLQPAPTVVRFILRQAQDERGEGGGLHGGGSRPSPG